MDRPFNMSSQRPEHEGYTGPKANPWITSHLEVSRLEAIAFRVEATAIRFLLGRPLSRTTGKTQKTQDPEPVGRSPYFNTTVFFFVLKYNTGGTPPYFNTTLFSLQQ